MENAVAVGIGMASPRRIDEINILQATYEAMREAVSKLEPVPQILLNDAVTITRRDYTSGADHKRGCQEYFHCSCQHCS